MGESLRGPQARFGGPLGQALTYQSGVATYSAFAAGPDPQRWEGLARLLGQGEFADMLSCSALPPTDWEPAFVLDGRQMIWTDARQ